MFCIKACSRSSTVHRQKSVGTKLDWAAKDFSIACFLFILAVKTDVQNRELYCPSGVGNSAFNRSNTIPTTEPIIEEEESLIMYLFVYQYFIILKLIVGPLLFSIFSVTASKWVQEIDVIWKFQRYHLVIDFANRLPIPEPFSLAVSAMWISAIWVLSHSNVTDCCSTMSICWAIISPVW